MAATTSTAATTGCHVLSMVVLLIRWRRLVFVVVVAAGLMSVLPSLAASVRIAWRPIDVAAAVDFRMGRSDTDVAGGRLENAALR